MPPSVSEQLYELADPAYRDFASSLIPGGMPMLGIRLPSLRRLARQLANDATAWRAFMADFATPHWMEEVMLLGMLPGYIPDISLAERVGMLERFIPFISNWSICDSCCTTCRFMRRHRYELHDWLQQWLCSTQEYKARFGIVNVLLHYLPDPSWAPWVAERLTHVQATGYYATMAAAWCCCELYLCYPQLAAPLLSEKSSPLPEPIRHKTVQKIRESRAKRLGQDPGNRG